jgi:hypothetical protein
VFFSIFPHCLGFIGIGLLVSHAYPFVTNYQLYIVTGLQISMWQENDGTFARDIAMAGHPSLLVDDVRPDCLANFRFQSPDVSFNSRREGQNRKYKRDGAAGYMLRWGGTAVKGFSDSPANRQLGD